MYRVKKSIPLSEVQQGYICFRCRLYKQLPDEERLYIDNVIADICRGKTAEHRKALHEFVTTDHGSEAICLKHYISRATLFRMVPEFYMRMAKRIR